MDMFQNEEDYRLKYEEVLKELEFYKKQSVDYEKLRADKTFGVAVCGDVLLNKLEVEIVDTKEFQRLRKVRQLGSAYLVYPSAVHTRFEHSLGVLKQTEEIIRNIKDNLHSVEDEKQITPEEEQIVRLLALLHDIGHMPFGHTIEDEFGIFRIHDRHETRWEYLLGKHSVIGQIIIKHRGLEFHKNFFELIKCNKDFHSKSLGHFAFLYDIVSNTVCADLLDYLVRDCFYTNLKLTYHPRFLNYFFIAKRSVEYDKNAVEEKRIAIRAYKKKDKKELRRDIISELIQLLRNRYYLGERVYYHHTKIMTGTLIAGAVVRARTANMFEEIDLQKNSELKGMISANSDSPEDKILYNVHIMGDEELVSYLIGLSTKSKTKDQIKLIDGAIKLANAFDKRILYKQIIYKTKDNLGIEDEFDTFKLNAGNSAKHAIANSLYEQVIKYGSALERLSIEENICDYLDMSSGDVLVYCPNFNMAMKLASALMENNKQELKELREFEDRSIIDECKSIIDKHQALWALRIYLHPKYGEGDAAGLNRVRIELIIKYFDWILLATDSEDQKKKGAIFWNSYYEYFFETNDDKLGILFKSLENKEKRKKQGELNKEFLAMTNGTRNYPIIKSKILKKFITLNV